jgi:parvulin-like peptidyl-prolyl isomerase
MTRFSVKTLCLAGCLAIAGMAPLRADDSDIVARVGDSPVTVAEVRTALQSLDAKTQQAAANDPSTLSQVVRLIITQKLVLKEALANKWDQDPSVTAALARLRDNAIEQTYLANVSKPPDGYPSDTELQAAYDANKSKLIVPRRYHLAQIFIKAPKSDPDADAKAQVKLAAVRTALSKRDSDFAAIARADSDEDESAAKGGELGWLSDGKIQPEIRSQIGALVAGKITQAIRLDDGYHFLKVLEVKEPYNASLEEVKPELIQEMRSEKTRANSQLYVQKLTQEHPIQVNELALSKVLKAP